MTTPGEYTGRDGRTQTTPMSDYDKAEYVGRDGLESSDGAGADAAAAFARIPAWHALGYVAPGEMTKEEALERSHTGGWDVHKVALQTVPVVQLDDDGATEERLDVAEQFAVVRTNPYTRRLEAYPRTSVGTIFTPIQNEDLVEFAYNLIDESSKTAMLDTIGSLQGGTRVFVSLKLPKSILVGGEDAIDLNLAVLNNLVGKGSLVSLVTGTRIVCANTWRVAMGDYVSIHKIRHTASWAARMEIARRELTLAFKTVDSLQAELDRMVATPMTEAAFVKDLRKIWPVVNPEDSKRGATIQAERESQLVSLFNDSPTLQTIKGTRWGALNAVTEWADFFQQVPSTSKNPSQVRAQRVVLDTIESSAYDPKAKMFDLLRVPVKSGR
jgi:phage/plasmid-like protein (TIGR03299 family)